MGCYYIKIDDSWCYNIPDPDMAYVNHQFAYATDTYDATGATFDLSSGSLLTNATQSNVGCVFKPGTVLSMRVVSPTYNAVQIYDSSNGINWTRDQTNYPNDTEFEISNTSQWWAASDGNGDPIQVYFTADS
jgi:hypothetical protein